MRLKPLVILLALLLLAATAYIYFSSDGASQDDASVLTDKEKIRLAEFEMQIRKDSADFADRYKDRYASHAHHRNGGYEEYATERFPFDPNTADSVTFLRLGLKPWQAHNALQYRRHGGRWRKPEAFLKLYGLSAQQGSELLPYIRIQKNAEEALWEEQRRRRDSLRATYPQKYAPGTTIPLNTADTTALKRIPGIGSYYAGKIVRYRERLGGFVSRQQLREIEGLPDGIEAWFSIEDAPSPVKLRINRADFKTLVRHPYLSYEQVKVILDYIRLRGPLKSLDELRLSKEFTGKDFERLRPYVDFR